MHKPRKHWTVEEIEAEASKYQTAKEWKLASKLSYSAALKRKITKQIRLKYFKSGNAVWTRESVEIEALKYATPGEWRKKSPSSYSKAVEEGFLSEITKKLNYVYRDHSLHSVIETALQHSSIKEWRKNYPKEYDWAARHSKLEQVTRHMTKSYNVSDQEKQLLEFIKQYYPNTHKLKHKKYEIDIFIPELNLGIEYNGLYYHSTRYKSRSYHKHKSEYFSRLGINLIHIWEHEWRNRKNQVLNFIKPKLKLCQAIGARKCEFKSIDWPIAKAFCEDNHIQGAPQHSVLSIGAFHNNELLGLATFSKHHRNSKDIVLSRLCFKDGWVVPGALSKISSMAVRYFKHDIYTWVHKTLSDGKSYEKAGWSYVSELAPDYFYITKNGSKIVPKQARQKRVVNTPESMTELQHATEDELIRVYDCGKIKLKYTVY